MIYEFVTLDLVFGTAAKAHGQIAAHMASPANRGVFLGLWDVDIGPMARAYLLRGYESQAELEAERLEIRLSAAPYGCETVKTFTSETYALFPGVADIQPGQFGAVYEFREYHLPIGGLQPSIDAWAEALPKRQPISPVLTVMYGLDGPTRMLHIVPWESLNARAAMRKQMAAEGIWPPKGSPALVTHSSVTTAVPAAISPLR
jgi:hypothetical protein